MKTLVKKHSLKFIGVVGSATAGYFYWKLVGCSSGICAITSTPSNSCIYGAIMGGLLFSIFNKNNRETA